ncbi:MULTISPECIES: MmgE/PrpD family protein [unclassified Mesorhizobium]|uniref:MmgE/PrpD family protein n=1 Tax=unclassified Mesorhizobium TaxID=325217 RepID=UPI000FDB4B7B|nr:MULTISPECIES: MmgE/PrpD family protein [unclassified Mesorhizobium]TGR23054.1 MmgE/PrpD family protein [Mesorhizobium sp. M8A.F.Ca.ET.197.01.1.1]TGR39141.1 MmgE/PrpD family protein [bacterium M00.F.Ca.ET.199.01.1.1]TGR46734.1 MmgE/PrpD family protein [Mesorhizobium sp. M8A.F.Ca.ET.198.01.1.1]TGV85192.1 MmgE/PrpD family protein [Mesorhizobium sp. M00.F.Ca.ET.149.01.1.1]
MTLTADLGKFLETVAFDSLPADAIPLVRDAFSDTIGVIMSGIAEPIVRIVHDEVSVGPAPEQARACLSDLWISAPDAALINGTAAHALDFDDQALTGHPSAILVPTILAEGEMLGASGRDMVTSYAAGYEVWAELVRRSSNYHMKGWHPTSVFGSVASAAATAVLRKLPADRASAALALSASHASGLAVNFGTMTKPYHAGMAARSGIIAARLAAKGATASRVAMEHPRGFLTAFSPTLTADRNSPSKLGEEWHILGHRLCVKRYPTCYFMHRSFDATAKMLEGQGVNADDVESITVTMGRGQTNVLVNERPQTGLEAKFSEHFAMAAAVILGRMGIAELSDEVVLRTDIQAFFQKVSLVPVDAYDTRDPAHSPSERVVVQLKGGKTFDTGEIRTVLGHAFDPLSTEQLWEKFRECTVTTHSDAEAELLFARSQMLPDLASTAELPTKAHLFG